MTEENYKNDLTFDERVMMGIVRAAENFKRTHSIIFKQYGLSFPQYNILRVLDASRNGQNKISAVGKIMLTPGANMTGLAKRLEKNGFLKRKPDPTDERVTLLAITPKGRTTLKKIESLKDETTERILEGLTQPAKQTYLQVTKQIITATTRLQKEMSPQ
jgi:DNA-binding MarR family transcriptional regulator